jgi:hypothetical protein
MTRILSAAQLVRQLQGRERTFSEIAVPFTERHLRKMLGFDELEGDSGALEAGEVSRPFDLADMADDSFSVMDNTGRDSGVAILGIWKQVDNPADLDLQWDGIDRWESIVIDSTRYVYLAIDRQTQTVSIELAAALPDGTATVEIHPLWKIPWDAVNGVISWGTRVDMRAAVRLPGMA